MRNEITIENLVFKFNTGTISTKELGLLIEYVKQNEPDNALLELYQKTWDSASGVNEEVKSHKIYHNVVKKLNTPPNKQFSESNSGRYVKLRPPFGITLSKYAAVFVIAFGLSWLVHNITNPSKSGKTIAHYQKIEVPYGSKSKVELPDGTKVTLNSGSSLRYPALFGEKTRTVYLQGEAFFEVKKDKSKPFYVNTSGISIKVLGTTFNVKAYPKEKTVETTLLTGSVEIYTINDQKEKKPAVLLTPNQKAIFSKQAGIAIEKAAEKSETEALKPIPQKSNASFLVQNKVKTELYTAWKDNRLVFDNERFEDLIVKIERWYDVDIDLNYSSLKEAKFSGKFDKETIEQAMHALIIVTPFHYEIKKNKITITK